MKVCCVASGHDFNVTLFDSDKEWFQYIKEERISGIKHDVGFSKIVKYINKNEFKPDLIVFSYGDYMFSEKIKLYCEENLNIKELENKIIKQSKKFREYSKYDIIETFVFRKFKEFIKASKFEKIPLQWVQHDYAHILSGWMLDENLKSFSYGVSIDGGGSDTINKIIIKNPFDIKKLESIYFSRRLSINKVGKNNSSLGASIRLIGSKMKLKGMRGDLAGKIMGLQAYGNPDMDVVKNFDYVKNRETIVRYFNKSLNSFNGDSSFRNKEFLDLVSTLHKIWENSVIELFKDYIPIGSKVIYSGGCSQNTVTNYKLLHDYPNLEIVPHCYDGGLSLGCLAFVILKNKLKFPKANNYPYIQADVCVESPSIKTIKKIAKYLSDGKIIGWYQGNGECGPRALGARSILMNPAIENAKDILNTKVKHREEWRPFAPSVLEEYSNEWFDIEKSKYMMIAARVNKEKRKLVPAIVHKDNTSRIQTVAENDNSSFYRLLYEFNKITGIPLLLNTSLNEGGGPIVGNPDQAKRFFKQSGIDVLCIGNKIFRKIKIFNHNFIY